MSIRCDIYDRKLYDIWFAAAPYAAKSKPAKTLRQWAADEARTSFTTSHCST